MHKGTAWRGTGSSLCCWGPCLGTLYRLTFMRANYNSVTYLSLNIAWDCVLIFFLLQIWYFSMVDFGIRLYQCQSEQFTPGEVCFIHPIFRFWFLVTFGDEVMKISRNLCLHFARQDGQDRKNIQNWHWNSSRPLNLKFVQIGRILQSETLNLTAKCSKI